VMERPASGPAKIGERPAIFLQDRIFMLAFPLHYFL